MPNIQPYDRMGVGGDEMSIGQRITTFRKLKGLSIPQLAALTHISAVSIRKYEHEKVNPKTQNLQAIAKALDVSLSDLDESLANTKDSVLERWDKTLDTKRLADNVRMFDIMISLYGEDLSSSVNDFLENLNPEGQKKVSEYIELLIPKYKK